jgi:hypothetical protein
MRSLTGTLLCVCLLFMSCNDNQLNTLSRRLKETTMAVDLANDTITQAVKQGLVSDTDVEPVVKVLGKISNAVDQAKELTAKLQALSPEDKKKLLAIALPLLEEVSAADGPIAKIKNEKLRAKIQQSMLIGYTALNAIKLSLQE